MTAKDLYDRDFVEWTRCNAALLRAGRLEAIDAEHLAEEIEDMGAGQERELRSRLRVVLTHLLKLRAEPGSRARQGWKATVRVQRDEIRQLLRRAPSLRARLEGDVAEVFALAVSSAAAGTRLPETEFPGSCPFSLDQILDDESLLSK
jgi:hypothetical protein